ncbi:hypothetical protein [Enterococcus alishanensis]
MDKLKFIYDIFHAIGVRKILFIFFILIVIIQFFRENKKRDYRNLSDTELEEIYQKDDNGLFPWEVDTDDSPDRISKDAKRHIYKKAGPRRGRW